MGKHLTLSDRAIIEKYLAQDMSFSFIANRLNLSAATISREIKKHRCKICRRNHTYYTAHRAYAEYVRELSSSRKGIRTSPERLLELKDLLMPLVNKGQSINHIFATHSDEIGLSKKTIYNYIGQSAFRGRNIDLPKKGRYRQHHSHEVFMKFDYQYRKERAYTDFTSFIEQNHRLPIVEMDTVIGARNSGKVLLALLFREVNC